MLDYFLENSIKSVLFWSVGLVALGIAFALGAFNPQGGFPAVEGAKWQAVFLNNNQVYFGKLKNENATYVTLSDVYYLRTANDLDQNQSNLNLIKLGGELHGPEDMIHIPKASILFWENMKDDSRVVKTITTAR